ncbi:DUF805 domain-containing protein [uncultured Bartonella sp.]|uniref:DUF805 domain-containing protein n=1 Tax=uncultured Bartonella sp. TaxID=104108 RepID=UPI0026085C5D|nr:DUF805 domain-containing protein [uncultured Bartonella sp.]
MFVFSFFVLFLPMPALVARRLHDLNRSGWWAMPIALLFICTYMISVLSVLTIIFSLIISFLAFLVLMVAKAFICGLFKNGACDFSGHEFWDIFPLGVMPVGGLGFNVPLLGCFSWPHCSFLSRRHKWRQPLWASSKRGVSKK